MQIDTPISFRTVPEWDIPPARRFAAAAMRPLRAGIGRTVRAFGHWRSRARTERVAADLAAMPDYLLRDIGISRLDVRYPVSRDLSWRRGGW